MLGSSVLGADGVERRPAGGAGVVGNDVTRITHASDDPLIAALSGTTSPTVIFRPTITTSDAAYSANDVIGGIVTLASVNAVSARPVALRSFVLKDNVNQKPDLHLYFFRSSPAGTFTDNAAVAPTTADMGNLVYYLQVVAADWVSIPGQTKAVTSYSFDAGPLLGPATTDLFLVIVAGTSAPDYGANATDLTAELGFARAS